MPCINFFVDWRKGTIEYEGEEKEKDREEMGVTKRRTVRIKLRR